MKRIRIAFIPGRRQGYYYINNNETNYNKMRFVANIQNQRKSSKSMRIRRRHSGSRKRKKTDEFINFCVINLLIRKTKL